MDDLLSRIRELNLSHLQKSTLSRLSGNAKGDAPFAMSMSIHCSTKEPDHKVIEKSTSDSQDPLFDAFVATRSRVVRFYDLPMMPETYLSALFLSSKNPLVGDVPQPISLWNRRHSDSNISDVWATFRTHEEACAALAYFGSNISVAPALETDLEPYENLQRFALTPAVGHFSHVVGSQAPTPSNLQPTPTSQSISSDVNRRPFLSPSPSLSGTCQSMPDKSATQHDYTLSTNPPNPRSNFRIGDWICMSAKCGVHNFGRNLVCIGCGCPRARNVPPMLHQPPSNQPASRTLPSSPRFATQIPCPPSAMSQGFSFTTTEQPRPLTKHPHPLLTPSGRAFAIGGRVRNISSDPLFPCIMYWPDNEPLPDQGQIRPPGLAVAPHPPILNTGNRGPISHQPGDWVCNKCNYLNWRRRKVCQTCLPYAEGNGDSISAAVQAERISLLTSVLAQTQLTDVVGSIPVVTEELRSHSVTPPRKSPGLGHGSIPRSHSYMELGSRYNLQDPKPQPIYQTSGHPQFLPLHTTVSWSPQELTPGPLLPAFLQDIIQSPTLSSSSASSTDLSFEEDKSLINTFNPPPKNDSASSSPSANIWRLDMEESRSLNAFALPHHHELFGARNMTFPRVSQAV